MKLFDATNIPVLGRAMDAYALRHKVIASNLANINTVGYRAKSVSFEDQLAGAMSPAGIAGAETDPRHMPVGSQEPEQAVPVVEDDADRKDGNYDPTASGTNDVDMDTEMAELAKNQIRYKFSAHLLAGIFKTLQESIRGTE